MGSFVIQSGADRIAGRVSDTAVHGGAGVQHGQKHFSNTYLLLINEVERRSPVRFWPVRGKLDVMHVSQHGERGVLDVEFSEFQTTDYAVYIDE